MFFSYLDPETQTKVTPMLKRLETHANMTKHKISVIPLCNGSCNVNAHCESNQEAQKCVCNPGWTGNGTYCIGNMSFFVKPIKPK